MIESSLSSLERSYASDDLETRVKRWIEESEDHRVTCAGTMRIRSFLLWKSPLPSLIYSRAESEFWDLEEWTRRSESDCDSYGSSM